MFTLMRVGILAAVVAALVGRGATAARKPLPRIRVDDAHHGFVRASGGSFVPFGVSYYRNGTGWAPQLWKQFDEEATRKDFALLKKQGCNVVRVFVTLGSFYTESGKLDPEGLKKFDRLLDLAEEAGIYVHPTGPGGWEGVPDWAAGLDIADNRWLTALEQFWRLFAARYRGRGTIWAYDLQNEPTIGWSSDCMRTRWAAWRTAHKEAPAAIPDAKGGPETPNLAEYQRFRESLGAEWVARQADAIHGADPEALVTVGLIQWSIPAQPLDMAQYAAFRPSVIAPRLDFMELHYYPLAVGVYKYESSAEETANLAVLESMARECAKPGLPLVIAEFGWYGGGPLDTGGKPATEEQQAEWCRHLVEVTSPLACGWLNWGMRDNPDAKDVSVHTGLFTADGVPKAWGKAFLELSRQYRAQRPTYALPNRPDLPWDTCTASRSEAEAFRQRYLAAFTAGK